MSMAIKAFNIKRNLISELDSCLCDEENQKKLISIAWTDLTLCIPKTIFNEKKTILHSINGFFEFGTINALMGPSGAGKTTLLNCMNGLYTDYLSNETNIFLSKFRKIRNCFITQNQRDHILTGLTAKQSMIFASKLKNSRKDFDHMKNVEEIMNELMITNTYNTNVENCSGGEQKRLVIGMELTSALKPNLLCIDEPTSGLDSNDAEVIIKCLKKLSMNHNICVITSIHQPNSDLLEMFDKLYVLSKGGHCVYSGRPQQLSNHLYECDIELSKEQFPIEVLLKYSCNDSNDNYLKKMNEKTNEYERQLFASRSIDEIELNTDDLKRESKRFCIKDLGLLIERNLIYFVRYFWKISLFQFCMFIFIGIYFKLLFMPNIGIPSGCINLDDVFNDTCPDSQDKMDAEDRLSTNLKYNFFVAVAGVCLSMIGSILTFSMDLQLFYNEHRNGWYSTGTFYWSKSIVEMFPTTLSVIGLSYIIDIYEPEHRMFFNYSVFLTLGALQIQGLSHVFGILTSNNTRMGVFTILGISSISIMFSNLVVPIKELHYSLQAMSNLVTVKLVMESIMILFYGFGRCDDREFSYILYLLGIDDKDLFVNIYYIVLQFFLLRALALTILMLKVNPMINSKKVQSKRESLTNELRSYRLDNKTFI